MFIRTTRNYQRTNHRLDEITSIQFNCGQTTLHGVKLAYLLIYGFNTVNIDEPTYFYEN